MVVISKYKFANEVSSGVAPKRTSYRTYIGVPLKLVPCSLHVQFLILTKSELLKKVGHCKSYFYLCVNLWS